MLTFKQFLTEQAINQNVFIFAFGRYSPPTKGHILHLQAIKEFAERNHIPYMVYASKTQDAKKNPISPTDKIAYIKKAIPDLRITTATNMFGVIDELAQQGEVKKVFYFTGSDYFEDQTGQEMFARLKSFAQEKGIDLEVKMSRQREPASEISGTALRAAAVNNDLTTFAKASPLGMGQIAMADVQRMFELTQQGLVKPAKKTKKSL